MNTGCWLSFIIVSEVTDRSVCSDVKLVQISPKLIYFKNLTSVIYWGDDAHSFNLWNFDELNTFLLRPVCDLCTIFNRSKPRKHNVEMLHKVLCKICLYAQGRHSRGGFVDNQLPRIQLERPDQSWQRPTGCPPSSQSRSKVGLFPSGI